MKSIRANTDELNVLITCENQTLTSKLSNSNIKTEFK